MMQRPLVGAADIHARSAAHRFQALQNLDILCAIAIRLLGAGFEQIVHDNPNYSACRVARICCVLPATRRYMRSEEHTSELQSLMRISYDVFCLKKKNTQ